MSMVPDHVRTELAAHEQVIERGMKTFIEVGTALADIRDARLYREDYATFEAYCEQRWGMSDRRARQLMEAASTVRSLGEMRTMVHTSPPETGTMVPVSATENGTIVPVPSMSTTVDIPLPTTESQARELSGLTVEQAADVMRTAAESGEKVTAESIRQARQRVESAGELSTKLGSTGELSKLDSRQSADETETHVNTDTGEVVRSSGSSPEDVQTSHTPDDIDASDNPFAIAHRVREEERTRPAVA